MVNINIFNEGERRSPVEQCSSAVARYAYGWALRTDGLGPVNGVNMVDHLVNKHGWVRCGREHGAVASVSPNHTYVVWGNGEWHGNWNGIMHYRDGAPYPGTIAYCKSPEFVPEPAPVVPVAPPAPPVVNDDIKEQLYIASSNDDLLNATINFIRGTAGNGEANRRAWLQSHYPALDYYAVQAQVNANIANGNTRVDRVILY